MRYVDLTVNGEPLTEDPWPVDDGDVLSVPAAVTVIERPDWVPPPPPQRVLSTDERVDALEWRLDAVAALAEKANATATEVAQAAAPITTPRRQ